MDVVEILEQIARAVERTAQATERMEKALVSQEAEYLSLHQAALITGLSERHIRRAVHAKKLLAFNAGTERHPLYRIKRSGLEQWMEERKGGEESPPAKPLLRIRRKALANDHYPDL